VAFDLNVPRVSMPQGRRMRFLWIVGASLIVVLFGYNSCTTYVKPAEAGVKQINFGIGRASSVRLWHRPPLRRGGGDDAPVPVRLQVLELSNSRSEEDLEGHRIAPGVNIQTSEGYAVQLDLTVLYRIADPLKVMQTIGPAACSRTAP